MVRHWSSPDEHWSIEHGRGITHLVHPPEASHNGVEAVLLAGVAVVALTGVRVGDALLGEILVALLVAPEDDAGAPPRRADWEASSQASFSRMREETTYKSCSRRNMLNTSRATRLVGRRVRREYS